MTFFKKKITIPVSNETKEVDAVQLWEVRFFALEKLRICYASLEASPVVEVFFDEQTANDFVESLRSAQKLLRLTEDKNYPGALKITVTKAL